MSAWIVSEKHILTLAYFYEKLVEETIREDQPIDMKALKKTARILWSENVKSVNHRYNENNRTLFSKNNLVLPDTNISMETLTKQIHCWEYQTCEHKGYNKSKAWRMMCDLQVAILTYLMYKQDPHKKPYDGAKWGI